MPGADIHPGEPRRCGRSCVYAMRTGPGRRARLAVDMLRRHSLGPKQRQRRAMAHPGQPTSSFAGPNAVQDLSYHWVDCAKLETSLTLYTGRRYYAVPFCLPVRSTSWPPCPAQCCGPQRPPSGASRQGEIDACPSPHHRSTRPDLPRRPRHHTHPSRRWPHRQSHRAKTMGVSAAVLTSRPSCARETIVDTTLAIRRDSRQISIAGVVEACRSGAGPTLPVSSVPVGGKPSHYGIHIYGVLRLHHAGEGCPRRLHGLVSA
jgi:hypothetical protein